MYEKVRWELDPRKPYQLEYSGVIEEKVAVGGKTRRMLVYVPEEVRMSASGVFVLGENGQTADDLLQNSGWRELADQEERKEKMIIFFLEPEDGTWNTREEYGKPDGDVAYINAATMVARDRVYYCIHEAKLFLVGCREGGQIANMAAAWNPSIYAGLVSVGADEGNAAYFARAERDYATDLDGYMDQSHRKNILKGEIPVPAWIIRDTERKEKIERDLADYWRSACGAGSNARQLEPDRWEYYRTTEPEYYPNQEKEAYHVCFSSIAGSSRNYAKPLQRRIWKSFLDRHRRWMSSPGGDLRMTLEPVSGLGMDYHYELYDGWMREWYVYVPERVRQDPQKKVPLVMAMHGYACSAEIYIGNSDWHKAAEKYGFIVIYPTALPDKMNMEAGTAVRSDFTRLPAWNTFQKDDRPDELRFFHHMLDTVIEQYPVDEDRVFATGHSYGSLMTEMLAFGMTERLAGVAPCSGVFFGDSFRRMMDLPALNRTKDMQLPIWMFWGMEEEWLIPPEPTHDNDTGVTLEMWLRKNGKEEMIPQDWNDREFVVHGRFKDHFYEKEGTAPVWFTQVEYMPHATMPEMSFRIWEKFFSKLKRNRAGN